MDRRRVQQATGATAARDQAQRTIGTYQGKHFLDSLPYKLAKEEFNTQIYHHCPIHVNVLIYAKRREDII